jgi:signal peptidase II
VNNTNPILSKKVTLVTGIILLVLILDQWLKIWVKTHMTYGEDFPILGMDWAYIHFVENNGMAFGLSLGGDSGKLALSIFRLVAVGFLIYFIGRLIKEQAKTGVLVSFALIMAGAMGNIIDSCFYGLIFSESNYHGGIAEAFPEGGGYSGFLFGKVVDMFYFPMIDTVLPSWVPFWGGERFQFFKPVFNLADASISLGVFSLLLFQRSFFKKEPENTAPPIPESVEVEASEAAQQEELKDDSSESKA